LKDWTPGDSITVERNENYWDSDNLAKTGKIEFKFVTDDSALTSALESGEIDGAYEVPLNLESSDAGTLYLGQSTQFIANSFTERPGPVQDVRIREALSLALDRDAVAQSIFKESAIGSFSYYSPATWTYAEEKFEAQFDALPSPDSLDLEAAEALVQDYVSENGEVRELKLEISADDSSIRQLATYIESQAEKVGVPVKVVALPANQSLAVAFDPGLKKQYDMLMGTGYLDIGDPLAWAIWGLTPGGAFNDSGYDNPEVTKLINEARQTSDGDTRADLLGQIQDIAYGEEFAGLMMTVLAERLFLGNRVTGVPVTMPANLYYPWSRDLGATGN
jgi:peptide/nickel transport system substrate-binding protein